MIHEGAERFQVTPTVETHFSWLRTRLSLERTAMAWSRTSIALIGFGFTIYQVMHSLNEAARIAPLQASAPRDLGLMLIGAGVLGLAVGLYEYRSGLEYLWSEQFQAVSGVETKRKHTLMPPVMILLMFIGIWAFVAVYLRAW